MADSQEFFCPRILTNRTYHAVFLWLTTCNRDAPSLKRCSYEHLRALFKLQCTWCQRLELENGHLSTATLSIKGKHWPPCHKNGLLWLLCLAFQPVCHSSDSCLSSERGFLLCRQWNITKSSIMLPLAHCTTMDAALSRRWAVCWRGNNAMCLLIIVVSTVLVRIWMHLLCKGGFKQEASAVLQARFYLLMLLWNQKAFKKRCEVCFSLWPTSYPSPFCFLSSFISWLSLPLIYFT